MKQPQKAYLLLADGTLFEGYSFGETGTTIGEIVFTTGMTGYQETLTDPSYYGQIVTQTFPLIGNYGINSLDGESDSSAVKGYIVKEWCEAPSNFRCEQTVHDFLCSHHIIGMYGIDTRALTRKIREHGVMNGMITTETEHLEVEKALSEISEFTITGAVEAVSTRQPAVYGEENSRYHVALLDYGCKKGIIRSLLGCGCRVTVLPCHTTAEEVIRLAPDGIMLSNGPGDPADNPQIIEQLKKLCGSGIPIFGICLGHQLLALANGAKTVKLKYGHRGANQPVCDRTQNRVVITSQNHGYAVVAKSLNPDVATVSHHNANDGTCEGVRYHSFPGFSVQFHPEACAGPQDTAYIFGEFIHLMQGGNHHAAE